ncbi:MAG: SDR family NAD(P)-dependent oxidoreductase [Candidatus Omnitrophota bacterium]
MKTNGEEPMTNEHLTGMEIAIIGMDGRFPGAKDIDSFWENLTNGVESVTFFSDDELVDAGVNSDLLNNPAYVKCGGGILDDKDGFDAMFFGYTPVEAELMDPQTRLFLETAWHALEDAGYNASSYPGLIGLYAGSGYNFHWEALAYGSGRTAVLGEFASWALISRDNLCTLVSYNLGLKGPSVFVKTACSTSLVAVHLACQGILNGECDMALAGGVSVSSHRKSGYLYQEGMIVSPDGYCRAFDENARGTFSGEGVGVVLLKRLEDAQNDHDHIHAIIKGTAINNDGARKIGYTAPSIPGQVDVIRDALHVAQIEPETMTYIEAHGTGTPVGDPIEIEALKTAFKTTKKGFCPIGSVKTNIGHLDAAAGIAGLIKTVLALKHHQIPPSLHFETPNSKIDFENSPFYVNTKLSDWNPIDDLPRRAGVSSFGIGGTNAHVILEENASGGQGKLFEKSSPWTPAKTFGKGDGNDSLPSVSPVPSVREILLLSAKTQTALDKITANLADYLTQNPGSDISDIAFTLQTGRKAFKHRRMMVCSTVEEAAESLSAVPLDTRKVRSASTPTDDPPVVFMFPGLGPQFTDMGRDLYASHPIFQKEMNRCFDILKNLTPDNIKEILYPSDSLTSSSSLSIDHPQISSVVIFMIEYALSKVLINLGIKPRAVLGYSFGEYTAACISGVLSLDDTLKLIITRGNLIARTSPGAMLSVPIPKDQLQPFLKDSNLSLAIDNGPSCVVSGPISAIESFEKLMKDNRLMCVRLAHASHAIHSHLMNPILTEFENVLKDMTLKEPKIPYVSNVTGTWVTSDDVTQPQYWTQHLSQTVYFADGIKTALETSGAVFIEVGPGYDLSVLLRHHTQDRDTQPTVIHLIDRNNQRRFFLDAIGRLWLSGVSINWNAFHKNQNSDQPRNRVPLPLYPFEHQRYWIDYNIDDIHSSKTINHIAQPQPEKKSDIADWFYVPSWKRSPVSQPTEDIVTENAAEPWLVFIDETGLGERFAHHLERLKQTVIRVTRGLAFDYSNHSNIQNFTLNPRNGEDYLALFSQLAKDKVSPNRMAHFWNLTPIKEKSSEPDTDDIQYRGLYSLFYIARAYEKHFMDTKTHMQVIMVSNGLHRVIADEPLCPAKATVLGAVRVVRREYVNIACRSIDVTLPEPGSVNESRLIEQLFHEFSIGLSGNTYEPAVALRGDYRWEEIFEPVRIEEKEVKKPQLKENGVYLVTGGLGGIGLVLAEHLARTCRAKLILTGRSAFPDRSEWSSWLTVHNADDPISQKINKLLKLEKVGAELMISRADISDYSAMKSALTNAVQRFGTINGIIHAAGLPDGGMISLRTIASIETIMASKVNGTLVLDRVLEENHIQPDFLVLCSSISAVVGMFGQIGYCAANSFLDAFAFHYTHDRGIPTVSIDWDFWQEVGMGVETVRRLKETAGITDGDLLLKDGILSSEGASIFQRVLSYTYPQVIVSVQDLASRLQQMDYNQRTGAVDGESSTGEIEMNGDIQRAPKKVYPRPELSTEYVSPMEGFEQTYAEILQHFFGFERVGAEDNLFEYGITSLDVIHINNVLTKKLNIDIPIVVMFSHPTIRSLGQYLIAVNGVAQAADQAEPVSTVENLDQTEDLLHESINIFDNFND